MLKADYRLGRWATTMNTLCPHLDSTNAEHDALSLAEHPPVWAITPLITIKPLNVSPFLPTNLVGHDIPWGPNCDRLVISQ